MWLAGCDTLVLATGNPHKVRELYAQLAALNLRLLSLADFPDVEAVAEDGTTLAENARFKAAGYARRLGCWVLSDDTGLEVEALAGEPGVRSARFAGDGATMAENRARLLERMADVPDANRAARFVCRLAVAAPEGTIVLEAEGICRGKLRREPAGGGGFGYDTLFEVDGTGRTLAQLDAEETARFGHRGAAVRSLLARWREVCR